MRALVLAAAIALQGCQATDPFSLQGMFAREAHRAHGECVSYYLHRSPQLVYPDPTKICEWVYRTVRSGRTPTGWRL